jgi:methionyl aminopeptidase
MIARTEEEYTRLREAGKRMAAVVRAVLPLVVPGVAASALDAAARAAIEEQGGTSSFFGYKMKGDTVPFPGVICVSVNDEVVHGIPHAQKIIKDGDIVSLDFGMVYNGAYMDTAHTVLAGNADTGARALLAATQEALSAGIAAARPGGKTGDVGAAVSAIAKRDKLGVIKELSGHGVGGAVHEPPYVPNYGKAGKGDDLPEGMVIAIEPMFTERSGAIVLDPDQWTYRTKDGSRAAHCEHTVLLTKDGPEILTAL